MNLKTIIPAITLFFIANQALAQTECECSDNNEKALTIRHTAMENDSTKNALVYWPTQKRGILIHDVKEEPLKGMGYRSKTKAPEGYSNKKRFSDESANLVTLSPKNLSDLKKNANEACQNNDGKDKWVNVPLANGVDEAVKTAFVGWGQAKVQ